MNPAVKQALAVGFEDSGIVRSGVSFRERRACGSVASRCSIALHVAPDNEDAVDEDDRSDALLEYVIKPRWEAYRLSPLFNFDYTTLDHYASKITQYVTMKMPRNGNYTTTVKLIHYLKLENGHPDALQINVFNTQKNSDNPKQICSGVLLSWGLYTTGDRAKATRLPLMLCKGLTKVILLVQDALMKLFDCVITRLCFDRTEMLLFSSLITSCAAHNSTKVVKYVFNVPSLRQETTITMELSAKDIHNIWLNCFPEGNQPSVLNEETSRQWYAELKRHIDLQNPKTEMNIEKFELVKLDYPSIVIQQNGMVKFNEEEIAKYMLKILCDLSVILKTSTPSLAAN